MTIEAALKGLCGRVVEARIEDLAGLDPVAPPRTFELLRVAMLPEGTHIKCYLNLTQYLSIPVFDSDSTHIEIDGPDGTRFTSVDHAGQLIYSLVWK